MTWIRLVSSHDDVYDCGWHVLLEESRGYFATSSKIGDGPTHLWPTDWPYETCEITS